MVVVHRDPARLGREARGAIRGKWKPWRERGMLAFIESHLDSDVKSIDIRDALG
jgi:hypothetical protein